MHIPLRLLDRSVLLVDALADLDDPAGFAGIALPRLGQLIGCDVLTHNEIGLSPPQACYFEHPVGALSEASREVFVAHLDEHPLVTHYRRTRDTQPVKISDFVDRRQFHSLGIYTEFFGKIPVEHQLAVALAERGQWLIALAFNRASKDFTEAERDLLSALQVPLATAIRRAAERRDARLLARVAGSVDQEQLTEREKRILELVAHGYTNIAMGHMLDISPRTVAKHLERIYRKLGVQNRAAAIARTAFADTAGRRSLCCPATRPGPGHPAVPSPRPWRAVGHAGAALLSERGHRVHRAENLVADEKVGHIGPGQKCRRVGVTTSSLG